MDDARKHGDDSTANDSETERQDDLPHRATKSERWLSKFDPTKLGLLGFLAVPGWFIDSLAFFQLFSIFFLFFLWKFIRPVIDAVVTDTNEAEPEPTDWIKMGGWREWIVAYLVLVPTTFLNPLLMVQDVFQLTGSVVGYARYQGAVPDADHTSTVSYRLPVKGTWTVVNGSLSKEYSHSWFPLTQRYAYDFVITDADGRTRPEVASTSVEEYYCYDEPVLAPADGIVVDLCDSDFEWPRGGGLAHPLKRDIRGNYVTIQHASNEYSSLVHLVPGSIDVNLGDRVEQGQQVARCGHSGNSSEPHLHFQLQDSPSFETAAGLPVRFTDIETDHPSHENGNVETRLPGIPVGEDPRKTNQDQGRESTGITAGQRITADNGNEVTQRANRDCGESVSLPSSSLSVIALLQRTGFGVSVGALLAGVASLILADSTVTLILSAAVITGLLLWATLRLSGFSQRPGGLGLTFGIGLIAFALWIGPVTGSALVLLFLAGFLFYVTIGEFERLRLQHTF